MTCSLRKLLVSIYVAHPKVADGGDDLSGIEVSCKYAE
jgi:hypothetical protein